MSDIIDFVITWVDGNDPVWRKERDRYAALEQMDIENTDARYRNWETLRYWFRGVEKFAPWVNKIFFVTCGHLPEWLDTDNPKIQIVKHSDFIPAEYLPTFNSSAIELYFNKIKGLSEQFVYFNDDMFLLDEVKPSRFFRNGLPCDIGGMTFNMHSGMFGASVLLSKTLVNKHFDKQAVIRQHPSKWFNRRYIRASLLNAVCLSIRGKEFPGFVNPHMPYGYLKKTYDEIWRNCEKDLVRTSRNRFRAYGNIAPWLIRYWHLASNDFSPYNPYQDGVYYLLGNDNAAQVADCIQRQKKKMICINDSDDITDFESLKDRINGAFETLFPGKSSFELF